MMLPHTDRSVLQEVNLRSDCRVWIKRDDLIHPFISGNKWRKLRLYLEQAQALGVQHIITAGGPFSNHILAVSYACAVLGLRCTALIRGRQQPNNHYRMLAALWGLQSVYLNHQEFAARHDWVRTHHPGKEVMFIEVGGAGDPGAAGCAAIWDEFPFEPDVLVLATATGTTMQGLLAGRDERKLQTQIIGIPVLFNVEEQSAMLEAKGFQHCVLESGFECGGFARVDAQLMGFIEAEIQRTNILFDPVYTGKAWFGLHRLIERGSIAPGAKIVFLHTGGSLGLFSERYLDFFC